MRSGRVSLWALDGVAYLNMRLVVVSERQLGEPKADIEHGVIEERREGFVVFKAADCFPDKVKVEPTVVRDSAQQVRNKGIVVGIVITATKC